MNRDPELELLLAKLRNAQPTAPQMARWQAAVQTELATPRFFRKPFSSWTAQMAAVLATGFLLGALTTHRVVTNQENQQPAATIQYTFSKSE